MIKRILILFLIFSLTACTQFPLFQGPRLGPDDLNYESREVAALTRDQYELTQENLSGEGGSFVFFWGLFGGTSEEDTTYEITDVHNVDGLMITRRNK